MKYILSVMLIISLVFLVACQPMEPTVEDSVETVTEEPVSTEEAEISSALEDFEELDNLDEDLGSEFEDLENLNFE